MPLTHWLKKTFDEKRGTPKMQWAPLKRPLMKKEALIKHKGSTKKTSDEKNAP
jgi:hypothetical protein